MSTTLSYDLQRVIRLLPGYDPFAQAGDRYVFDEEQAATAIQFVEECCTFVEGPKAGEPFVLEDWQQAIIGNVWGWRDAKTGLRRYREAFVFVPRGNGKTELAAVFVCLFLYLDPEKGARLYSAAAEADQARLCFDRVAGMIRNEPLMQERTEIYKYAISTADKSYKYLSATAGTKHGFNVQLIVNDELHVHKTPELTEVLLTGMGKRPNPLAVHITTADYERENSICNQKHDYACKVRDGVTDDPQFLPAVYEASKEDDWTNPDVWRRANPNYGVSVMADDIERKCAMAKEDAAFENTFKRLHLNIRTEAQERWINTEKWDACTDADLRIEQYAAQKCWAGMDLASIEDFTAVVLAFRDDSGGVAVLPHFWIPAETARKKEVSRRAPYAQWAREGYLTLTESKTTNYDAVRQWFRETTAQHKLALQEIATDPIYNAQEICRKLEDDDGFNVIEHRQGFLSMALPVKQTKEAILGGTLRHDGNPVLRWMMSNVVVRLDEAGNEKPDKKRSAEKIDGVVAMVMAVGRALADDGPAQSVYKTRGIRSL